MYKLILTCSACPEQYNIVDDKRNCKAYIRLRWGHLTCRVPDVGGETIYDFQFDDGMQGCFYSEESREYHLNEILKAFSKYYKIIDLNIDIPQYADPGSDY